MLTILQSGPECHLSLNGTIGIAQAQQLWQELREITQQSQHLTLDVGKVSGIDSSILQIFLVIKKQLEKNSGSITLINHSPECIKTMLIMGLNGCFNDPVIEVNQPADRESHA